MIGLIRKDLYYLSSSWKPLSLSILIVGVITTWKGFGIILIVLLPTFFGMSVMGCIQIDAQKKWYDYHKILPISLKKVVASRYLAYLLFAGIGLLITIIYGYGMQYSMGIASLGKHFALWQGYALGIALALGFASFFIPATYFNKGEKMEVSMMLGGLISFGIVYLSTKVISLLGFRLMDYTDIFIQMLFVASIIAFLVSWVVSNSIYQRRAYHHK